MALSSISAVLTLAMSPATYAQTPDVFTIAGSGADGLFGEGIPATDSTVRMNMPTGVVKDAVGNVYIADTAYVEDGVHITGPAYIGKGVRVFHGADLRGPVYIGEKSLIGQYVNVRQSMVSQHCIVGAGSEVNRSYLGQHSMLHAAMILDSVLADSENPENPTNISARTVAANLRADRGNVKSTVKGQPFNTQRNNLGAIVGSGAFIAVNAMLMPGVKIGENGVVGPSTVVLKDVPDNTRYYVKQTYGE